MHHVSKNVQNCLSDLHQIAMNFDNFWQNDGEKAEILRCALIFHFT